jgi:Holliday junction DNA helicase RuvA
MIAYLSGTVIHKGIKHIVVDTKSGVGYKVSVVREAFDTAHEGNAISLWIYTVVREDALDLYGFLDKETMAFFELLIGISGIGPKSALGILSAASVQQLREAVLSGETAYLTKIAGISKKVSDKIVLELKGKVGTWSEEDQVGKKGASRDAVDAIEALKALGYTNKEALDALDETDPSITDPSQKVKAALRILGS